MNTEFCDLVAGVGEELTLSYLKIDRATLRRWKAGKTRIPHSAVLALKLKLDGDLTVMGGKDWDGFYIGWDALLYNPY